MATVIVRGGATGFAQEIEISLTGPLDAAQRERLLEIADRCPVPRALVSELNIRTRLV